MGGSNAYGLAHDRSDEDWRGVYQVPTEALFGLKLPPDHYEFEPDQQYWELTHFAKMCLAGNPNIMELLWLPEEMIAIDSVLAQSFRAIRGNFISANLAEAYFGWIKSERFKLAPREVKVNGRLEPALPSDRQDDLIAGKRGSHLVRLTLNLRQALTEGQIIVRLGDENLDFVKKVKAGRVPAQEVLDFVDQLEWECRQVYQKTPLGAPNPAPVEQILLRARRGEL
jgi:predicted nucleotidyltransferase